MIMRPMVKSPMPVTKTMVTIRPEVVSVSSRFMQMLPPVASVVQMFPAAHEAICVVVDVQPIVAPLDLPVVQ